MFDVIKNLSFEKDETMKENDMAVYESFVINKGLSLYPDTIFYANELNMNHSIPNEMQWDYYFHSLRSRKRWSKWPKKTWDNEIIEIIQKAYNVNFKKAISINKLLSKEQIGVIEQKYKDNKNNEKGSE